MKYSCLLARVYESNLGFRLNSMVLLKIYKLAYEIMEFLVVVITKVVMFRRQSGKSY